MFWGSSNAKDDFGATSSSASRAKNSTRSGSTTRRAGEICGNLWKQSKSNPQKWRKKWFALKGDKLWYCTSRRETKDFTFISLLGVQAVKASGAEDAPKHCFEINAPHQQYHLRASSSREMQDWIDSLRKKIHIVTQNQSLTVAEFFISDTERAKASRDIEAMRKRATMDGVLSEPTMASALQDIMKSDDDSSSQLFDFLKDLGRYKRQFSELALDSPSVRASLWSEADRMFRRFFAPDASKIAHDEGIIDGGRQRDGTDDDDHQKHVCHCVSNDPTEIATMRETLEHFARLVRVDDSESKLVDDKNARFSERSNRHDVEDRKKSCANASPDKDHGSAPRKSLTARTIATSESGSSSLSDLRNMFNDAEADARDRIRDKSFRRLQQTKIYSRWVRYGRLVRGGSS